jgi:hypothetical protein
LTEHFGAGEVEIAADLEMGLLQTEHHQFKKYLLQQIGAKFQLAICGYPQSKLTEHFGLGVRELVVDSPTKH